MNQCGGGYVGSFPLPVAWDITNDWHASTPTNPSPVLGEVVAQFQNPAPYLQIDITDYVKSKFASGVDISGVAFGFQSSGYPSNYYWLQLMPYTYIHIYYKDYRDDYHIYAVKETLASSSVKFYSVITAPPGKTVSYTSTSWWMDEVAVGTYLGETDPITLNLNSAAWYVIECERRVSYTDNTSETRLERITVFNPGEPPPEPTGIDYQIKISNNYGTAPLTTFIEDVTSYSTSTPKNWIWNISDGTTKIGKRINVLFDEPGIYSATMTAYSDTETFMHEYEDIIFVLDDITVDGNQIELAHNSTETAMRHKITTTHTFNDDDSSLSFNLWSSEMDVNDVGNTKVFSIKGNDTCESKNIMPMISDAFKIGSETSRWIDIISNESESELNQSKSLRLWGGK